MNHSQAENPQSAIRNPQLSDGVLVIDKPADWTSHDVVAKVRKLLRTRRVGHTGTLDPFATGVLVVCVNQATRLVQYLTSDEKEYVATMRLGYATDTGDLTGTPLGEPQDATHLGLADIEAVLPALRGQIQQVPPMYSAKKVGGVKLYEMARRGETIERAAVAVEIKTLELLGGTTPDFELRIVCSAGTYIRTLAESIGAALGVGAHLTALRRTRAGAATLAQALTLEQLATLADEEQTGAALVSMNDALALPTISVSLEEKESLRHGRAVPQRTDAPLADFVKLCDAKGNLLAVAAADPAKRVWQPKVVFNNGD